MTTADALLASVVASPDDDLPRLVYADWLEENGQPERGEFIRLQIARESGAATAEGFIREKVLLDAHGKEWLAPLRAPSRPLFSQKSHAEFTRGFVQTVWLPVGEFARHADRLFALAPVTELRLMLDDWFDVTWLGGCHQLSRLKALEVCDSRFGPACGGEIIARHRYLTRLRVLRLIRCNLDDSAAAALCESRLSLDRLDLRHNPFSDTARAHLRERFGDAVLFE